MAAKIAPLDAAAETTTDVLLLKFESGMFGLQGDGITTITIAATDDIPAAAAWFKDRLALVAAANPWICGTVVKEPQHGKLYALRFPAIISSVDSIFSEDSHFQLADDMTYVELVAAVKKTSAWLPIGKTLFKTQQPICKLTFIPRANGFAIIFSMSHMVANGGTYTQILNMIASGATPVTALNPVRKQECWDQMAAIVGRDQYAHMMGTAGGACNAIAKLCCGAKPTAHCFLVDDAKLAAAREQAASALGSPISANDVLTSGFGNVVRPRLLTMACDFKGRVDGLTRDDAGNYHLGLYFDRAGYADPGGVRTALRRAPPMSRASLPGCCEEVSCRTAIITSWAGFVGLDVPGCMQHMHFPCTDIAGLLVKALNGTCIVFNPLPGKLAVLCTVTDVGSSELLAGMPLGQQLSSTLWP